MFEPGKKSPHSALINWGRAVVGNINYVAPATHRDYIEGQDLAVRLRPIATQGSEADLVLGHLEEALDQETATSVIVLRAMIDQAKVLLGD